MNIASDGASTPDAFHSLERPEAYPHHAGDLQTRETHISKIFLAGEYAYKIKKPVRFDFLDYSTLELRRACCEKELSINRRFAPELYLDVVSVCRDSVGLNFRGSGVITEWAVKMKRFRQEEMLLEVLRDSKLRPRDCIPLADYLANDHRLSRSIGRDDSHRRSQQISDLVPRILANESGVDLCLTPAQANLSFLASNLIDIGDRQRIESLSLWSNQFIEQNRSRFLNRILSERIRECHGDLHLGNLLYRSGAFMAFDAIEFNESFRWIDVANELAFLLMDLDDRGFGSTASVVLDRYLEMSGDYDLLGVLRFYQVYRALVRAKVEWIRQSQAPASDAAAEHRRLDQLAADYVTLAEQYTRRTERELLITVGVSGSGKSTQSQQWIEQRGFIRLRSDATRKRLLGLSPEDSTDSLSTSDAQNSGVYDAQSTARTYAELLKLARQVLVDGYSVVADATFLKRAQREPFFDLANELGVSFGILECEANESELRRRVRDRHGDASEATVEVLEGQLRTRERLTQVEQGFVRPLL